MKKTVLLLMFCTLLQFIVITPSYPALKNATIQYKNTLKKAKQGSPKDMFFVARMLEQGTGTRKNIKEASKWYQRSASQNYAAANARLGKLYLEGIGVKKNTKKAFGLLNLAAIQGIPVAQFNLALLYELGIGTRKDFPKAIRWYDSAAQGGFFSAKSKSKKLSKKLGISKSIPLVIETTPPNTVKNTTRQGIGDNIPPDSTTTELENVEEIDQDDENQTETAEGIIIENIPDSEIQSVSLDENNDDTDIIENIEVNTNTIAEIEVPGIESDTPSPNTKTVALIDVSPQSDESKINTQDELSTEHQLSNQTNDENGADEQETASSFNREKLESTVIPSANSKLSKQQKIALIKNENIKRTLKTLLEGRWFDKNRPVNFLPSPKAKCNIINQSDIKCVSRELQRHTDRETVYYKTLGKISKLTSSGHFLIQYQNTVTRVVVAEDELTEDGVLYKSKIEKGLQYKIHQLNCQYQNISSLICIRDKTNKYTFKNRAIVEKNSDAEE